MNQRLQQFLAAENISQSQFADSIGVARASVSHILAGRNKPGFDFIESMSRRYPALNLEWLITGKGRMYTGKTEPAAAPVADSDSLFAAAEEPLAPPRTYDLPAEEPVRQEPVSPAPAVQSPKANTLDTRPKSIIGQRSISKVIVFFDDGTYQEMK